MTDPTAIASEERPVGIAPTDVPASLHFHGPFKFINDGSGNGIARCPFAHAEGVYLWVLRHEGARYIHYVGQTTGFLSRHMEHLTEILGLNYGLFRPDAVAADDPNFIFCGMWRLWRLQPGDDPLTVTAMEWESQRETIIPYLESIEVFFAPTILTHNVRRHVEGCIAANLRQKHSGCAKFYPQDCRTGMSKKIGITIPVTSGHPIMGLDDTLEI